MNLLLDTNVVLDALLNRAPWSTDAKAILSHSAAGRLRACVAASALTDVYYIARKIVGRDEARNVVRRCLDQFAVVPVHGTHLRAAFDRNGPDFEDDLQIVSGQAIRAEALVTRDVDGFSNSPLPVLAPSEVVAQLASNEGPADE